MIIVLTYLTLVHKRDTKTYTILKTKISHDLYENTNISHQ